jgi:FkbM family methyltransferase
MQVMVDGKVLSRGGMHHIRVRTIDSVMAELNHTWVDVLKIDVEGSEWGALQRMLAQEGPLPFAQMQARLCCCCC